MVGTYLLFKLYKYPFYYFLSKLNSLRFSTSMQIADLTKQFTIAVVDLFSMRGYCTLRMSAKLAYPQSCYCSHLGRVLACSRRACAGGCRVPRHRIPAVWEFGGILLLCTLDVVVGQRCQICFLHLRDRSKNWVKKTGFQISTRDRGIHSAHLLIYDENCARRRISLFLLTYIFIKFLAAILKMFRFDQIYLFRISLHFNDICEKIRSTQQFKLGMLNKRNHAEHVQNCVF